MILWQETKEAFGYDESIRNKISRFKAIVKCSKCNKKQSTTIRSKSDYNKKNNRYLCMKCRYDDPVYKRKRSTASKELWNNNRDKIMAAKRTDEYINKMSESIKRRWDDDDFRRRVTKSNKLVDRSNVSEVIKEKWKDNNYIDSIKAHWTDENKCNVSENKKKHYKNNLGQRATAFLCGAGKIHGDKYDYSVVEYVNSHTKVDIICPEHGRFSQTPANHLNGQGCPHCGIERSRKIHTLTTEEFIDKANAVHDSKYLYNNVDYKGMKNKVRIVCPKHGEFHQTPVAHLHGIGCQRCASESRRLSGHEFIDKADNIHDNFYDYSGIAYVNHQTKIKIVCPKHGEFEQTPNNHLSGKGCPKCAGSSLQNDVYEFIKSFGYDVILNDRIKISPYELDIFVPEKMLAIELHGLYWHSYDRLVDEDKHRHVYKCDLCNNNNIRLIQIFENEWLNHGTIVKSILKSKLGVSNKIYARKCDMKEIDSRQHTEFMDQNHIQGSKGCSIAYGLIHHHKIMAVMSFNKHPKHQWEVTRFANKLGTTVVGGASKLFKRFIGDHIPNQILTYADRRYSDGNLYRKLGFEFIGHTKPNYFYVKNHKIYSRHQFQKHKLKNKLDSFDESLSEVQNMFNNGYRRIWDAGHYKFVWRR